MTENGNLKTVYRKMAGMRYFMAFVGLFLVLNITMPIVVFMFPAIGKLIYQEDNLVENLSALAFFCAFATAAALLITRRISKSDRKFLWFIAPISLLGFLDELSFGQRLFHLEMPSLRGVGIDAVHDLIQVAYELFLDLVRNHLSMTILISTAIIVLATLLIYRWRDPLIYAFTRSSERERWWMIAGFSALVVLAQLLDLELIKLAPNLWLVLEELFELEAALILIFAIVSIVDPFNFYRNQ